MRQISGGIAAAHGVNVSVDFRTEFIETFNSTTPTQAVIRAGEKAGLDTVGDRDPMSFSEDFAHFCQEVPGCLLLLGNGLNGPHGRPLHSDTYDFNDALIPIGVEFWMHLVEDRLPANPLDR